MPLPRHWHDLASPDFAGLDPERSVALLPVAAVEQHGPHLPLGTDAFICAGIVGRLCEVGTQVAEALILPPQTVGNSLEHTAFAGSLHVPPEVLVGQWTALGMSVARVGVRKLLILNTHGGQRAVVDLVAMRLRAEAQMLVVRANYPDFGAPAGLFDADELALGLHGGEVETSLMLHLHPALVRREQLRDFRGLPHMRASSNRWLGVERPVGFGWMAQDLHPCGVCGNAAAADPRRGALLLDHITAALAALLDDVADFALGTLRDGGSYEWS